MKLMSEISFHITDNNNLCADKYKTTYQSIICVRHHKTVIRTVYPSRVQGLQQNREQQHKAHGTYIHHSCQVKEEICRYIYVCIYIDINGYTHTTLKSINIYI